MHSTIFFLAPDFKDWQLNHYRRRVEETKGKVKMLVDTLKGLEKSLK